MNFLVNPSDVIDYNRTDAELELFWLFCSVVAGKTATTQSRLLDRFLSDLEGGSPFDRLAKAEAKGILLDRLKTSSLGQYNRLYKQFLGSLGINLKTCTVADLEGIYGCGPKTARMFVMMTRKDQKLAALDTHVLKFLKSKGFDAPKTTPSAGPRYAALEKEFVKLAEEAGKPVAEFDLEIWKSYSR